MSAAGFAPQSAWQQGRHSWHRSASRRDGSWWGQLLGCTDAGRLDVEGAVWGLLREPLWVSSGCRAREQELGGLRGPHAGCSGLPGGQAGGERIQFLSISPLPGTCPAGCGALRTRWDRAARFPELSAALWSFQASFGKQRLHFNSKFTGSKRLCNTCNFSILGPGLQGSSAPTSPALASRGVLRA